MDLMDLDDLVLFGSAKGAMFIMVAMDQNCSRALWKHHLLLLALLSLQME